MDDTNGRKEYGFRERSIAASGYISLFGGKLPFFTKDLGNISIMNHVMNHVSVMPPLRVALPSSMAFNSSSTEQLSESAVRDARYLRAISILGEYTPR